MYYTDVMNREQVQEYTDEQIMDIVKRLRVGYELKRTMRCSTARDFTIHSESVAEHVFALFFLSEYFRPLEDPEKKFDVEKLCHILLFHDFGEIVHGDVPYHMKTDAHRTQEKEDAEAIFDMLPTSLGKIGREGVNMYETQDCPEARFAYALDKIEPIFELLDPVNELSMKRLKFTYRDHIERKSKATEGFPIMRRFLDVVTRDMVARDVFWKEETATDSK